MWGGGSDYRDDNEGILKVIEGKKGKKGGEIEQV